MTSTCTSTPIPGRGETDAGLPETDAGAPETDAGTTADAGAGTDAGGITADAGPGVDADEGPTEEGGCACRATSPRRDLPIGGGLMLLAGIVLGLRRRRR